jgi:alpha-tubulin suppressor-like RCC1 family protein|eukprot:g7112.t1
MASSSTEDFPENSEKSGEVVFAGGAAWSMTGRSSETKAFDGVPADNILLAFHRLNNMRNVPVKTVISGPMANHSIIISGTGVAYSWGRNEDGQLGVGDTFNRYNPQKLDIEGNRFRTGACGLSHSFLVTTSGDMFCTGANAMYQLGTGRNTPKVDWVPVKGVADVRSVGAGRDFSMLVDINGKMFACGSPMYGQLGNGSENKSLEKAGKWTYDCAKRFEPIEALLGTSIKMFSLGANHTAALDVSGKLYTWGFGGYGRLGLGHAKDAMLPTPVSEFSQEAPPKPPGIPDFMWKGRGQVKRVSFVACGAQCTYAIGTIGQELYFFGITKQSGEATMRPQLVDGVSGWRCRSVAAGQSSTILAASYDHPTLITWGGSPTYGELGYGDGKPKSNTRPDEVQDLNGATVLDVAMGYGHSLAIVKYDKKGKSLLSKMNTHSPNELDVVAGAEGKKRKTNAHEGAGDNDEEEPQKKKAKK